MYKNPVAELHVATFQTLLFMASYVEKMSELVKVLEVKELAELKDHFGISDEEDGFDAIEFATKHIREALLPTARYSIITFLHTIFETEINRVCDGVQKERNLPISVKELKGSEIERAKTYLTKLAGLDIDAERSWQVLLDSQKIRNCIVHRNGIVTNCADERRLRHIPNLYEGVSVIDERIVCDERFCRIVSNSLIEYFERVFDALQWTMSLRFEK